MSFILFFFLPFCLSFLLLLFLYFHLFLFLYCGMSSRFIQTTACMFVYDLLYISWTDSSTFKNCLIMLTPVCLLLLQNLATAELISSLKACFLLLFLLCLFALFRLLTSPLNRSLANLFTIQNILSFLSFVLELCYAPNFLSESLFP